MDIDLNNEHVPLLKFGNVLKDFQVAMLAEEESFNAFSIVQDFRAIAGEEALQLAGYEDDEDRSKYANWELEAKLWDLVGLLIEYRSSEPDNETVDAAAYNSSVVFKKKLLQSNKGLYEIWLIRSWIQANMPIPERPDCLPTTKWTHSMLSSSLKSMDADSVLRDATEKLVPEDRQDDHVFFRYAYQLLLAGQYEKLIQECEYTDNLTLNLILRGLEEYVDPSIDNVMENENDSQQGIKKHALWRRSVYELSKDESLDPYEAAIYTFLSGDSPSNLRIDEVDWESELLIYLNQIWNVSIENFLIETGKIPKEELIVSMDSSCPSLSQVLNIIAANHPSESEHPLRILIGSILLNTIGPVVKSSIDMLVNVVKGLDTDNDVFNEPYLLRVLTNLIIYLDIVSPGLVDNTDKYKLITSYTSLLSFYGLHEIVPVYVSFLSDEEILDTYSYFLTKITDPELRRKQIEISRLLQLPTANILRRTAQRVFDDSEEYYLVDDEVELTSEISDVDERLMLGVEWLIEGELHIDSIDTIIAMARRFLINGKVKALGLFFDRHDITDLLKEYQLDKLSLKEDNIDLQTDELEQFILLVNIFKKQDEWVKSSRLFNSESNLPLLVKQFKEFSSIVLDLVTTFLVDLVDNSAVNAPDVLYEIRALYIPFLIMELHNNFIIASESLKVATFVQEAIDLSILVANETDKIYLLFQSSRKLTSYLQMVAKASAVFGK